MVATGRTKITARLARSKLMDSGLQSFLQHLIQSLVKSTELSSKLNLRENIFYLKENSVRNLGFL